MQIVINTEIIESFGISVEESLNLLRIADSTFNYPLKESYIDSLQERLFIKVINEDNKRIIVIRDKGNEVLRSLYGQKLKVRAKPKIEISNDFKKFITEYRSLWKGLKVGSMGSLEACTTKMERWISANPDYSQDDILRAARLYLQTVDNPKYLQAADYFIYKQDQNGNESSRLSAFIDEKDPIVEDDWSTKLV